MSTGWGAGRTEAGQQCCIGPICFVACQLPLGKAFDARRVDDADPPTSFHQGDGHCFAVRTRGFPAQVGVILHCAALDQPLHEQGVACGGVVGHFRFGLAMDQQG